LGTFLFIIVINDLLDICKDNIKLHTFADDAKIYRHIYSNEDKEILQTGIKIFVEWTNGKSN